jgi:hypothetical protein
VTLHRRLRPPEKPSGWRPPSSGPPLIRALIYFLAQADEERGYTQDPRLGDEEDARRIKRRRATCARWTVEGKRGILAMSRKHVPFYSGQDS